MSETNKTHDAPEAADGPRAIERKRFISEYRRKPKHLASFSLAALKYGTKLTFFAILILPPALFFWFAYFAEQYQIGVIKDLLSHVAMTATSDGSITVDAIGIAIWILLSLLFSLAGWFAFKFKSPIQLAADKHMMEWDAAIIEQPAEITDAMSPESEVVTIEPNAEQTQKSDSSSEKSAEAG